MESVAVDLNEMRSVEDLRAASKRVTARMSEIHSEHEGRPLGVAAREEFAGLKESHDAIEARTIEFGARERMVREIATRPNSTESEADQVTSMSSSRTVDREGLNLGLRALERHSGQLTAEA